MDRKRARETATPGATTTTPMPPPGTHVPQGSRLAEEMVWSRVAALRALDDKLEMMENALGALLELHQHVQAQLRDELGDAMILAVATSQPEPRLTRSFSFYFAKLVGFLKPRDEAAARLL